MASSRPAPSGPSYAVGSRAEHSTPNKVSSEWSRGGEEAQNIVGFLGLKYISLAHVQFFIHQHA